MATTRPQNLLDILDHNFQKTLEEYLTPTDRASLAMTCKQTLRNTLYLEGKLYPPSSTVITFFNSRINTPRKNLRQAGICILQGKKDEALNIIREDPALLQEVVQDITDKQHPSGRKYQGRTLYQLALGTYDSELYEAIGNLLALHYGHRIRAQQFHDQFPSGVKSSKNYRKLFNSLIKTIAADLTINFIDGQNQMNATTKAALQVLKDRLIPKSIDSCTTGTHFDLQIIIDFINAYENSYDQFNHIDKKWDQRALYWRCVFGLLENHVPYFIAMALNESSDFFKVLKSEKLVTRSTTMADGSNFFGPGLGVSHYVIGAHGITTACGFGGNTRTLRLAVIKNFCSAHITALEEYRQQLQNHSRPKCVIV